MIAFLYTREAFFFYFCVWLKELDPFQLEPSQLCSTALLMLFSVPLCFSQKAPPDQRNAEKQRKTAQGRKEEWEGVTLLLMIWNHKCKSPPSNACLAIACKAPHSCCWCRPFPGSDKQHTHMHSSQASLLSCPPFLSTQDMTIHAYRIISVFHAKQDGFFISAVGKTGHEQPGGLWSQSRFLNRWLSKYWKVSRLNYSP